MELPSAFPSTPAWLVSDPCLYYIYARTEHKEFLDYYHELAKRAVIRDDRSNDTEMYRQYQSFKGYMAERYVCQMADYFETYLEDILISVFSNKIELIPETERNKISAKLKDRLNNEPSGFDLAISHVKAVFKKSRAAILRDLYGFCRDISFQPSNEPDSLDTLKAVRNLIVHQDGFVDTRFLEKISGKQLPFETTLENRIEIPENWQLSQGALIDATIFELDYALVTAGLVRSRDRRGHFWIRRNTDKG